ncbi:hypothetical protein [Thermostaphylospora chromogena]|uniref:Uncharacterized protein n=1 Tax=Thermostaphylospora chromogena TaxID=35622 RepID=A0A1H1A4M7_9ACTN|nr:hypothetical protein [Thermostaphylospora chromogena]SDQ34597.1 hypothetical protein SAMN04489764_0316 [Thermostaphylospora chromogena]
MTDNAGEMGIRERIRRIDEELASLREEQERSSDPQDFGDSATELTRLEEAGRMVETLQHERERLLRRLEEPSG